MKAYLGFFFEGNANLGIGSMPSINVYEIDGTFCHTIYVLLMLPSFR
jgi:hypothetical protein